MQVKESVRVPSREDQGRVLALVDRYGGYAGLAKELRVSDQSPRQWAIKGEIPFKYWQSLKSLSIRDGWEQEFIKETDDVILNKTSRAFRYHNNIRSGKRVLHGDVQCWLESMGGILGLKNKIAAIAKQYRSEPDFKYDYQTLYYWFKHPNGNLPPPNVKQQLISVLDYPFDDGREDEDTDYLDEDTDENGEDILK